MQLLGRATMELLQRADELYIKRSTPAGISDNEVSELKKLEVKYKLDHRGADLTPEIARDSVGREEKGSAHGSAHPQTYTHISPHVHM